MEMIYIIMFQMIRIVVFTPVLMNNDLINCTRWIKINQLVVGDHVSVSKQKYSCEKFHQVDTKTILITL